MPASGGEPRRLTWHSAPDAVLGWTPDGKEILFTSLRTTFSRFAELFTVSVKSGMPEKLPLPMGFEGSYSPDGNHLAYITKITENYPFKRYRGGLASDIIIYDLKNNTAENITHNHANDGKQFIRISFFYLR